MPSTKTAQNEEGEKIISAVHIQSGQNISYTFAESLELQSGFTIGKNSNFIGTINKEWQYKISNPTNLINSNNCYSSKPPFIMSN